MSTPDPIARHHLKWTTLPLFTPKQWVASDEDIAAWSDILHMRTMVDQIEDLLDTDPDRENQAAGLAAAGLVEFDIDLYLEPWTDIDRAADMLAAWKANGHTGTARIEVI